MSSEYLPLKIQAEILKRLPLRSILRFRSVSKPWKHLVDTPEFIASYGVRHPQPHRFILSYQDGHIHNESTYFSSVVDDDYRYVDVDDEDRSFDDDYDDHSFHDDDYDGFEEDFHVNVPYDDLLLDRTGHPCVVGSSHGLLCFKSVYHESYDDPISQEMLVLWNPSIRKSVCIHVPYMYDSPNKNFEVVNAFGFGVCPVTYDPTILKIKWMNRPSLSPWRVRVFTLSTGTWNVLSTNLPRESIELRGSQVVIHRFIYWAAFDMLVAKDGRCQSPFLIMSFDLTTKEFKEINLTGCLSNRHSSLQAISKLQESLVLLGYHREFEGDVSVCSLWTMKEQGDSRSFTKLYNINVPDATVKALLGFRKTGEIMLVTERQSDAELEIYDPYSEGIADLGICGRDYSFFMCSYTESLVLLNQLDGFVYSIGD